MITLAHGALLFASPYLLGVGLLLLGSYVVLAWRYWFSIPFRGIVAATILHVAAPIVNGF